ncbi:hypothetical protein AGOR_G00076460 [Albula goreensis]|uniref:Receptor-type tyrosine-protein phosphatase eta-like n=1 Tax=Albula goreensis TaxID=1534307 RepID=A0A8T3DTV1_9TELE|nr:hypothetical protein AGOR_G00076460 [Albula goreensis]
MLCVVKICKYSPPGAISNTVELRKGRVGQTTEARFNCMSLKMGKTGILLLIVCACCSAERQYFPQGNESTWEEARSHCQICYKELVSLTSDNIQLIAKDLTSDYWIGLRKDVNSSLPWSWWSNGDPLTFQNWYPGQPKQVEEKPPVQQSNACKLQLGDFCRNDINITEYSDLEGNVCILQVEDMCMNITNNTTEVTPSLSTPLILRNFTEEEEEKEKLCVSLLRSGLWFEKNCTELLPYICYEDRFYGDASVSNVTLHTMTINWMAGPGDIDLYRVEVRGDMSLTKNTTNLTLDFGNLTAGTEYRVQVFPVKCERDLNPQNVSFYTFADSIINLTVKNVTNESVCLSWVKPAGNHGFYTVNVVDHSTRNTSEETICIEKLRPGQNYTIAVNAEVEDPSRKGEPSTVLTTTKPSEVRNLTVHKVTEDSIILTWEKPVGNACCYRVVVKDEKNTTIFNTITHKTNFTVGNLTAGTKFCLSVVAIARLMPNESAEGEAKTVMSYTKPRPVPSLNLMATSDKISATWNPPDGNFDFYEVILKNGTGETLPNYVTEMNYTFGNLNSAVKYTVSIRTVVDQGSLKSDSVSGSKFTFPEKPENLKVFNTSKTSISLEWEIPPKLKDSNASFEIKYNSSFWNHTYCTQTKGKSLTLSGLRSGTKYMFELRTLAGNLTSNPISTTCSTEPVKTTLILTIQCSSKAPLSCEKPEVKKSALDKLKAIVKKTLSDQIYSKLNWRKK